LPPPFNGVRLELHPRTVRLQPQQPAPGLRGVGGIHPDADAAGSSLADWPATELSRVPKPRKVKETLKLRKRPLKMNDFGLNVRLRFVALRWQTNRPSREAERAQALRVAGSISEPQLPQNLSPAGTAPRQLGHTRLAAVIGVTVAPVVVGTAAGGAAVAVTVPASLAESSPPVAFLSSRSPSPMARPSSGSLPGPKIRRTMTRMTIRWPGCSAPIPINSTPPRTRCTNRLGRCLLKIARQWDSDGEVRGSRHAK